MILVWIYGAGSSMSSLLRSETLKVPCLLAYSWINQFIFDLFVWVWILWHLFVHVLCLSVLLVFFACQCCYTVFVFCFCLNCLSVLLHMLLKSMIITFFVLHSLGCCSCGSVVVAWWMLRAPELVTSTGSLHRFQTPGSETLWAGLVVSVVLDSGYRLQLSAFASFYCTNQRRRY